MPLHKERKAELVAALVELLQESDGFAVVRTQGLPVTRIEALRGKIREAGGQYFVAKNSLLSKALEQVGWVVPSEQLVGPTAIAFGKREFPAVAKALLEFVKTEALDAEKFAAVGGVMSGKDVLTLSRLEAVSNLPTLDEIRAQLAGIIVTPATGLVTVLDAANGQIVNVIQALLDDKKAS